MAASPRWKVYSAEGEYRAACRYIEDAAALVAALGQRGTTIRLGHRASATVWTDGVDGEAAESYDAVAARAALAAAGEA